MTLWNVVCISCITLFFALAVMALMYAYVKKSELELAKNQIMITTMIDAAEIEKILDDIVDQTFEKYIMLNMKPEDLQYIQSDKEIEMVQRVSESVMGRITEYVVAKLSLVYKIDTVDALSDIITNKVYVRVMAYVIDTNSMSKKEKEDNNKEEA